MKVIVASKNPVKIGAASEAFATVFPVASIDVSGIEVESGVDDQPNSDAETRAGARARVSKAVAAAPDADFWVGLEGGVELIGDQLMAFAWMAVQGRKGDVSEARSATLPLPPAVKDLVDAGMELGEANDRVFSTVNSKQGGGAYGLLTDGRYTRESIYAQTLIIALTPFVNPLYPQFEAPPPSAVWDHRGHARPDFAEEPGPGQESAWDYPRPPVAEACARLVEVKDGDTLIARTTASYRVKETASPPTFYLPPEDVRAECLVPVSGSSVCEWKGAASYFALAREPSEPVAWIYSRPRPRFERIRNFYAFYPGRVACYVDGERVEPQPGRFYGGWITSDVVGPFKGEPGTGHW